MADVGESPLNLPLPLAHNNVLIIVRHHNRWHESFLPRIGNGLAAGGAEGFSQNPNGFRIFDFGGKSFADRIAMIRGDDQASALTKLIHKTPKPIALQSAQCKAGDLVRELMLEVNTQSLPALRLQAELRG